MGLFEKVNDKTYNKRISICKKCEYFIELTKQCKHCFCFLPIKARNVKGQCPIKKWGMVINNDNLHKKS